MDAIQGLTDQEVLDRRTRGEGNNVEIQTSRSVGEIVRANFITPFNIILFILGVALIFMGQISAALTSTGVLLLNVIVGTFQQIRAKRKLDQIALLTRPKITVVRNGAVVTVDPAELVKGDVVVVQTGDQAVVDGAVIDGQLEMDESLLTGETDHIEKHTGDRVLSGSLVVSGKAYVEAQEVGAGSFANKLTASARQFRSVETPVQREVNLLVRVMMLIAVIFIAMLLMTSYIYDVPAVRTTQLAVVIMGLIPVDLFLMITIAYAMGAVRIADKGALAQQSSAIEALSAVTVLCTDKTGTLTANRIRFSSVHPLNGTSQAELKQMLGSFAASAASGNKTSEAIAAGLSGKALNPADEVPFSSARKWSALAFAGGPMPGVYALGATEMLAPYLEDGDPFDAQIRAWSDEGLRVLLFARNADVVTLHDAQGAPALPRLTPLGLISFTDELRPGVQETITSFRAANIELKVISGDNPETVAALARQAGMPADLRTVAGTDLAQMSPAEFAVAAREGAIFGRITPEQKQQLVEALKVQGQFVAMTGDGVNDVLSLKRADVAVAMESGSAAARSVADILLLGDDFGALVPSFLEGQRIVSGMDSILRIFTVRIFALAAILATSGWMRLGIPTAPTYESIYALLVGGLPAFFVALWAKPARVKISFVNRVIPFALPMALLIGLVGTLLFAAYFQAARYQLVPVSVTQEQIDQLARYIGFTADGPYDAKLEAAGVIAQNALLIFRVVTGVLLVLFLLPPFRWFNVLRQPIDRRSLLIVGLSLAIFATTLLVPFLRNFFLVIPLRPVDYAITVGVSLLWFAAAWIELKYHLFDRFFGIAGAKE